MKSSDVSRVLPSRECAIGECCMREEEQERSDEILSCLDVDFDPIWGNVISFHPFPLDREGPRAQAHGDSKVIQEPMAEGCCTGMLMDALRKRHPETQFESYVPSKFNNKRLRSIHEFSSDEMVSSIEDLELKDKHGMNERICFLHLQDSDFGGSSTQSLLRSLNRLSNLEVVILIRTGLKSVKGLEVRSLLYLDVSNNLIQDIEEALRIFDNSKVLQYADFSGNPVLSLMPNSEDRLLASAPWSLQTLNRKPVEISRKVDAVRLNTKDCDRASLSHDVWDYQVCKNKTFAKMNLFKPEMIRHLDISCTGISVFHVGLMSSLEHLDLSCNRISSIKEGGIEQLRKLRLFKVSRNDVCDPMELLPLAHLTALNWLEVSPQNERSFFVDSKIYRLAVVLLTIDSKGSETKPGLNFLDTDTAQHHRETSGDWIEVTTQERLDAIEILLTDRLQEDLTSDVWSSLFRCFIEVQLEILQKEADPRRNLSQILQKEFYRCKLISLIGQRSLYSNDFDRIRCVVLRKCDLKYANVMGMNSLEVLDLAENHLDQVIGLERCQFLRLLDISKNFEFIDFEALQFLYQQLNCLHKLRCANVFNSYEVNKYSSNQTKNLNMKMIKAILMMLIKQNPIETLNGKELSIRDRVSVYYNEAGSEDYQMYLTELVLATSVKNQCQCCRDLREHPRLSYLPMAKRACAMEGCVLPSDVKVGLRYDPARVEELSDTHSWGLVSDTLKLVLPKFTGLRRLNLSRNRLVTLQGLGLEFMQQLVVLDVSKNSIKDELEAVADVIDCLPSLVAVALRSNPCFRIPSDRRRLMGLLKCFHDVRCKIRFIDKLVTLDERIDAGSQSGNTNLDGAARLDAAVALCCNSTEQSMVSELQLIDCKLRQIPRSFFSKFFNLKVLNLQSNCISTIHESGIESLVRLELFDMRNNRMNEVSEIYQVVLSQELLHEVGLRGNPFGRSVMHGEESLRQEVIEYLAPRKLSKRGNKLRFLDDVEISIEELIRGTSSAKQQAEMIRFFVSLERAVQDLRDLKLIQSDSISHVSELDMSWRNLSFVDFSEMTSLTALNLSHNRLTSQGLENGRITRLTRLSHLNLNHNEIADMKIMGSIISIGQSNMSLRSVSVSFNPVFPSANDELDRISFLRNEHVLSFISRRHASLQSLNSAAITVDEKCLALGQSLLDEDASTVRELRLVLLLEEYGASAVTRAVHLPYRQIASLHSLAFYKKVEELNLQGNRIVSLEPLCALPLLIRLDVSNNSVPRVSEAVGSLMKCDALRHLKLEKVSLDWSSWARELPADLPFQLHMFKCLPALLDCDSMLNFAPLQDFQWKSILNLRNHFAIGPNRILRIDLRGKGIDQARFYMLRDWLAFLPVEELYIQDNPFCRTLQSYRYILINDIRTLRTLDGCEITEEERVNAYKKVEEMMHDLIYMPPTIDSLKLNNAGRMMQAAMPKSSGAGASSLWGSQFETFFSFLQVQGFLRSLSGVPWDSIPLLGSTLDLLKPLASIRIEYVFPSVQCICFWGYLQSVLFVVLPLIFWGLYRVRLDWTVWEYQILNNVRGKLRVKLFQSMAAFLILVVISIAIDCINCMDNSQYESLPQCSRFMGSGHCVAWEMLKGGKGLPSWTWGWVFFFLSVIGFVDLVWLLVVLIARYKNRKKHNTGFWLDLTNAIKKIGMLLLVLTYLPVCNLLLDNVRPVLHQGADGEAVKWYFPAGGCTMTSGVANRLCKPYPSATDGLRSQYVVFWISAAFAAMYIIGMPLYLGYHIKNAVDVVDRNNPRHIKLLNDVKRLNEQLVKRRSNGERNFEKKIRLQQKRLLQQAHSLYQQAVCDFDDARTTLYCSYKWRWKYYKLITLLEKVLLLLYTLFLSQATIFLFYGHDPTTYQSVTEMQLQKCLIAVSAGIFFVLSIVIRPYMDWQDTVNDVACRVCNLCNALVIYLASDPKDNGSIFFPHVTNMTCASSSSSSFGLAIAGVSQVNLTGSSSSTSGNNTYCSFLFYAGYLLGALNIACLVVIVCGLLASPFRWFYFNRRAQKMKEKELNSHKKKKLRASALLGRTSDIQADGLLKRSNALRRFSSLPAD